MPNRAGWSILFAIGAVSACGGASDNDFFGEPSAGSQGMTGGSSGSDASGGSGGTKTTGGTSGKGGSGSGGSATGGTGTGADGGTTGGTGADGGSGGSNVGGDGAGATGGVGTGGSAGSAGMATGGAGGVSGSAGSGSGGTKAGNGGSAGSGEDECVKLAKLYDQALEEALACNPKSGKDQCTTLVRSDVSCGCGVYVNPDNEEAVAELERITKQADEKCAVPCPAIACVPPATGTCVPNENDGGTCHSNLLTTN